MAFSATLAIGELTVGYIETFDGGVSGWVDRDVDEMVVAHSAAGGNPDGGLSGDFDFSLTPGSDAFRAVDGSSGGAFTGDYRSKWSLISGWSFDVFAEDVLPSSGSLQFGSGSNEYFASFTTDVAGTGIWTSVFISLEDVSKFNGPLSSFSNSLFDVDFVEVEFTQNGNDAQSYRIDNFELTALNPAAASTVVTGSGPMISWTDLRAGADYRIEVSTNLFDTNAWTELETFVATNKTVTRALPGGAPEPFGVLRLVLPDPSL